MRWLFCFFIVLTLVFGSFSFAFGLSDYSFSNLSTFNDHLSIWAGESGIVDISEYNQLYSTSFVRTFSELNAPVSFTELIGYINSLGGSLPESYIISFSGNVFYIASSFDAVPALGGIAVGLNTIYRIEYYNDSFNTLANVVPILITSHFDNAFPVCFYVGALPLTLTANNYSISLTNYGAYSIPYNWPSSLGYENSYREYYPVSDYHYWTGSLANSIKSVLTDKFPSFVNDDGYSFSDAQLALIWEQQQALSIMQESYNKTFCDYFANLSSNLFYTAFNIMTSQKALYDSTVSGFNTLYISLDDINSSTLRISSLLEEYLPSKDIELEDGIFDAVTDDSNGDGLTLDKVKSTRGALSDGNSLFKVDNTSGFNPFSYSTEMDWSFFSEETYNNLSFNGTGGERGIGSNKAPSRSAVSVPDVDMSFLEDNYKSVLDFFGW